MTCIVGLVHDGVGYIAADSAISDDSQVDICATPKVGHWRGSGLVPEYLLGVAGDWRGCSDILRTLEFGHPNMGWESYHPEQLPVKEILSDTPKRGRNVDVLVVTAEAVWTYTAPLWTPLKHRRPYAAIGAGAPYALGYLSGRHPYNTNAGDAVKAASEFCPGVRGPVNILKTEAPHEQP